MISGAAQHGAYRGQDLAELVMQFARDIKKSRLLGRNQLLSQFAALLRQLGQLSKQPAVGADEVEAGNQDYSQNRCEKKVDLPLHPIVNLAYAERSLLLALIVLNQQPGDGRAQSRLARLQRQPYLVARFLILTFPSQGKSPIHGIPELGQRVSQEFALFRGTASHRYLFFCSKRRVQIFPYPLKLRRPS